VGFERGRGSASSAAKESFRELGELARSAGAEVVATEFQVRPVVDAATLFGRGKIDPEQRQGQNPGTDRTASEFPANGAGNPWQSCQSRACYRAKCIC